MGWGWVGMIIESVMACILCLTHAVCEYDSKIAQIFPATIPSISCPEKINKWLEGVMCGRCIALQS
jgi:hypothetical protein